MAGYDGISSRAETLYLLQELRWHIFGYDEISNSLTMLKEMQELPWSPTADSDPSVAELQHLFEHLPSSLGVIAEAVRSRNHAMVTDLEHLAKNLGFKPHDLIVDRPINNCHGEPL